MVLPNGKMKLFRAFQQPMTFQRVLKMPILVCFFILWFMIYDFVSKEKIFHMMMMVIIIIIIIIIILIVI